MKTSLILFVISISTFSLFAQPKGKYCDGHNWFCIDFISADSLMILKPFYIFGHLPAYGYGKYKIENDSLFINYNPTDTTCCYTTKSTEKNDSITLVFIDDERPLTLSYTENTDQYVDHLLRKTPIYRLKREKKDLHLEYGDETVTIPASIVTDQHVESVSIKLRNQSYIKEKVDNFVLTVINDSTIMLNGRTLEQRNCKKRPTPIF